MWNNKHCVSWLQERYEETEGCEISVNEIYMNYKSEGGSLNKNTFGKYVTFLFPKVQACKKWSSLTKKEQVLYRNFAARNLDVENAVPANGFSYLQQWVPSPFFVCNAKKDEIHYAMFCGLINGIQLTKKIVFHNNGQWTLFVGESKVNLEEYNVANTYTISRMSVHNVCSIVYKLRLCEGKLKANAESSMFKNAIIEYSGEEKKEIFRSLRCKRLLLPISFCDTCRVCQNSVRIQKPLQSSPAKKLKIQTSENEYNPVHENSSNYPDNSQNITLTEDNDRDMRTILETVLPEAKPEMLELLVNQKQNMSRNPSGRRWDKNTIRLCLSLWTRSKKNYQILRDSNTLILPSGETLRLYKGAVDQKAGFNKEVFLWMMEEAKKYGRGDIDLSGGIAIDEMSIQDDLCFVKCKGGVKLVGFVDIGPEADNLNILCTGKREKVLATHVLQFLFLCMNGFRFPFACFPVTQTKAGNLHFLFWRAVQYLNIYGFKVRFVSMDGAQTNRDFVKMFFSESTPVIENFSTKNIWNPDEPLITFIMDYSHVIKRVRNNILKSGDTKNCVRHLQLTHPIYWDHWINAFKWDRDTNSFPIHRKLTNDHLFLSQESKMRNKLAEEALNGDMLYLMECFQKSMGQAGAYLDDTVALLKATSVMVSLFRDHRPITDVEDIRLDQLLQALSWFNQWESTVQLDTSLSSSEKEKRMMSAQTRDDLKSCILGFNKLCRDTLSNGRGSVNPARINSDVIENTFCQQRGIINGNNTNPTFHQYVRNMNSVIIGQSAVSKNSNAEQKGCVPLNFKVSRQAKHSSSAHGKRKPLAVLNT